MMKKQSRFTKFLMLVLCLTLMLNTFNFVGAFAVGLSNETNSGFNLKEGDLTLEQLATHKLSKSDIPEIVSTSTIAKNGHVNRLWAQEPDLNSIVFQNTNGTKTLYHYSYPVKYIDENGKVKDKSSALTSIISKSSYSKDYAYVNGNNDIKTYLPNDLNKNGVVLETKQLKIEMSPITTSGAFSTKQLSAQKSNYTVDGYNKSSVNYIGVFGESTSIRYTPLFDGFKEDIILSKYTGNNTFAFTVNTYGLSLQKTAEGKYVFVDPTTDIIKAEMSELFIYDSTPEYIPSEETIVNAMNAANQGEEYNDPNVPETKHSINSKYNHHYEVKQLVENNTYIVTLIVDKEYLEDDSTIYPVYVDPTIEVKYNTYNTGSYAYLEDATIYNVYEDGDPEFLNQNTGDVGILHIGTDNIQKNISRSVFDFKWINTNSNPFLGAAITSAKLYVRDLYPSVSIMEVAPFLIRNTTEWEESSVTGANLWDEGYAQLHSEVIYYNRGVANIGDTNTVGNWYGFDITMYVQNQLVNGDNSCGIMLRGVSSSQESRKYHTFASSEYIGNPAYVLRPALVVDYDGVLDEEYDGGTPSPIYTYSPDAQDTKIYEAQISKNLYELVTFTPQTSGTYYFKTVGECRKGKTTGNSTAAQTRVSIYSLNSSGTVNYPGSYSGFYLPQVTFYATAGTKYYIRIWGVKTSTYLKYIIAKDYTNTASNSYTINVKCCYDTAFRDNRGGASTITSYMTNAQTQFKKYFNANVVVQANQYYSNFKTNSGDKNPYHFRDDTQNCFGASDSCMLIGFTGVSLNPLNDGRDISTCDVYWEDYIIGITRQVKEGVNCQLKDYQGSIFHEMLHAYDTCDHYCPTETLNVPCSSSTCYKHSPSTSQYRYHRKEDLQYSCVVYSPVNTQTELCGLCYVTAYKKLAGIES